VQWTLTGAQKLGCQLSPLFESVIMHVLLLLLLLLLRLLLLLLLDGGARSVGRSGTAR
jgi:hypothetical protein